MADPEKKASSESDDLNLPTSSPLVLLVTILGTPNSRRHSASFSRVSVLE